VPGGYHPLLHRQAPFRHDDALDVGHRHAFPMTAWTAASILAGLGM
jgi:hypothetical protein